MSKLTSPTWVIAGILFVLGGFVALADETDVSTFAKLKKAYDSKLESSVLKHQVAREKAIKNYLAVVDAEFAVYQKAANLDGMVAMKNEKERVEEEEGFPLKRKVPMPARVAKAETAAQKAIEKSTLEIDTSRTNLLKHYARRLTEMRVALTKAGEVDKALEVREAEQTAKADLAGLQESKTIKKTSGGAPALGRLSPEMRKSLVIYLPFERSSGGEIKDASGNNRHGKIEKRKWATAGKIGGACEFDGSANVKIPKDEALDPKAPFSAACWFKMAEDIKSQKPHSTLISTMDWAPHLGYCISLNGPSAPLAFRIHVSGAWPVDTVVGASAFEKDTWHHIVISSSGKTMRIYIDGELAKSTSYRGVNQPSDLKTFTIGSGFKGAIDELMMFDRKLEDAEVEKLFELGG